MKNNTLKYVTFAILLSTLTPVIIMTVATWGILPLDVTLIFMLLGFTVGVINIMVLLWWIKKEDIFFIDRNTLFLNSTSTKESSNENKVANS